MNIYVAEPEERKPVDYLEPGWIAALSRPLPENREEPRHG